MSENVILEIVKTSGIILTAILSLAGLVYTVKSNNKVEAYHKEVNGKMGELLDTTKKLGNLEGRAEQTQEEKFSNDKK